MHEPPTQVTSWLPQADVVTRSLAPQLSVRIASDAWQAAALTSTQLLVASMPLTGAAVGAVSLPIIPQRLKVVSYQFAQLGSWRTAAAAPANAETSQADVAVPPETDDRRPRCTRIKPPGDIIKLEDRLFYVLQPSLETLIGDACAVVSLPSVSLPVRRRGVSCIRATPPCWPTRWDWARRCRRSPPCGCCCTPARSTQCLLVCPKPLVTNWQREFAAWAPELPVTVIEGEQARRRWQWQQTDMPVKIANYELLQRDRELVAELGLQFDLVVLDEAQRIKNRASATSHSVRELSRRRSWALTGTPVENSPQDLVGIFEFLAPGYLSDDDEAAPHGPRCQRLRAAAHQGQGAHRPAPQDVSRRRRRADGPPSDTATNWPRRKACCG